ncbi:MAG: ABC transporter permease [bacterium]
MTRFIIRRVLYMVPMVLGVILVTFLLFNVVGGSPASMALGKNVSPQALEEFDEQRGFNKPVIFGWWTTTRAFPARDFSEPVKLFAGTNLAVQLLFPLRPDSCYRVKVQVRGLESGTRVRLLPDSLIMLSNSKPEISSRWHWTEFQFQPGTNLSVSPPVLLSVEQGALEVRNVRLERRMPHGLDSQLVHYFKTLARLDLGTSLSTNEKVTTMLRRGILPSLALTVPVFFGGLGLSVGLALLCAYWRNRWPDRIFVFMAVALMSVNYLVWIIFGQFFMAYKWHWFPIWGFESWGYLLLPVMIGILSGLGGNLRFYRAVILDEIYKDYVRTAFAKGLSPAGVLFKHVLPNAMIPIVTNTVIALPILYTGSLLLESFFGIPGLGGLSINAINSSDVDVVRGVVLVGALLYVVASLVTDLCYALVDPRVKLR